MLVKLCMDNGRTISGDTRGNCMALLMSFEAEVFTSVLLHLDRRLFKSVVILRRCS